MITFQRTKDGIQTKCGNYAAVRVAQGYAVIDCKSGHTLIVVKTQKEAKETILDFGF